MKNHLAHFLYDKVIRDISNTDNYVMQTTVNIDSTLRKWLVDGRTVLRIEL